MSDFCSRPPVETGAAAQRTISPMADVRELGPLEYLAAEAVGQPGQRRFRLQLMSEAGQSGSLWLEKEQLAALGEALETALTNQGYEPAPLPPDDTPAPPVFPLDADVEMRVVQLSMGIDEDGRRVVLIASDATDADEAGATNVRFDFGYRAGAELRSQIKQVVAAGRPPCRLCGGPIDPSGHVCVRSNGHHPN